MFICRISFFLTVIVMTIALTVSQVQGQETGNLSTDSDLPNIVILLVDQWRYRALGYCEPKDGPDDFVQTPHLDRLAESSLRFENAVSVCPVCTPYRAALLTGRFPTSTGMFKNDLYLPAEEFTIAEALKEQGYKTAYIGKWHLDGHGRLLPTPAERRQGFDDWKALECTHDYNNSFYYEGDSTERIPWEGYEPVAQARAAIDYLKKQSDSTGATQERSPFFLMVSMGTPHFPHETAPEELRDYYAGIEITLPPNVPDSQREKALAEAIGYYAHCTATDSAIGEIIDAIDNLNLAQNTILLFTSDHGEMLGSHDLRPYCKHAAFDESSHIPLLIRYPKLFGNTGRTVSTAVTTTDLYPTLLGLVGVPIPGTVEGESLAEQLRNQEEQPLRGALFMSVAPFGIEYADKGVPYRAIRTSRYTYAVSPDGSYLLFDHLNDPYEMNNLIGNKDVSAIEQTLHQELTDSLNKMNDPLIEGVCRDAAWYVNKWNYEIDPGKNVPFWTQGKRHLHVQSPIPFDPPKLIPLE